MKLNVRKRNGVWAVACDEAVLSWHPDHVDWDHDGNAWWRAVLNCQFYAANPTIAKIELGLRNAY